MPILGFGVYQNYTTTASVLEAFKVGYRHIDSAQAYRNEAAVGDAVRDSGIDRSTLFITTKCISKYHGYDRTLQGVNESLTKFGFDYIDLFLIHNPHSGTERRLATYEALQETCRVGKVRTVDVPLIDNSGIHHLEEIRKAGFPSPSVNQIELHPFCQQRPIVEYCQNHSIIVQAYCPLIRGEDGKMNHPVIQAIATKHGRDLAQILIRWSLQRGFVPIPKSATPSRIESNTHVYDFTLDADDMRMLDGLDRGADGSITWNPVEFP
ncbi:NADP-dependent oxidoreductase domain-containing protein [Hygrophoropsis aurantiaca]|uniref:NADP-dependent oxidoreductase domain-containing protein n=1 Tax=Hygrophoropsis aurantiaca TaxID=72124 RepID=A0ACB8AUK2_9AGAM|nr:NADP-dependent oxidoreductase domain-containing protein [Hygrophoropsis aurantiaca]